MDQNMKKALILGTGAVAGGWGGIQVVNRIGAAYGLRLGTVGVLAGAAVGALIGASVCKKLIGSSDDLEGEFEVEVGDEAA